MCVCGGRGGAAIVCAVGPVGVSHMKKRVMMGTLTNRLFAGDEGSWRRKMKIGKWSR